MKQLPPPLPSLLLLQLVANISTNRFDLYEIDFWHSRCTYLFMFQFAEKYLIKIFFFFSLLGSEYAILLEFFFPRVVVVISFPFIFHFLTKESLDYPCAYI